MAEYSDMEYAIDLAGHINNPCVDRATGRPIKEFYIRVAKDTMKKINEPAREFLLYVISDYLDE